MGYVTLATVLTCALLPVESQIGDVLLILKEVTRPHRLGIYLGIETYELEKIEKDYPHIDRQMTEVINYWLRNCLDCSWGALANAVEKLGGHGKLVEQLRDRHSTALKTAAKKEHAV